MSPSLPTQICLTPMCPTCWCDLSVNHTYIRVLVVDLPLQDPDHVLKGILGALGLKGEVQDRGISGRHRLNVRMHGFNIMHGCLACLYSCRHGQIWPSPNSLGDPPGSLVGSQVPWARHQMPGIHPRDLASSPLLDGRRDISLRLRSLPRHLCDIHHPLDRAGHIYLHSSH